MNVLCFGEILLRLSPPSALRLVQANAFDATYGGSEANVAVALAQWGLPTAFLTRVPDSPLGHAALGALARYGVDTRHARLGGERIGLYFLEQGVGLRPSRVLYDRAGSSAATLRPGDLPWNDALQGAGALHWSGITPALSHTAADALREGIACASDRGITISCDLNYRANLWTYGQQPSDVLPELVRHCHVLLGDRNAFDRCLGVSLPDADDPELLRAVAKAYPNLRYTAMTRRGGASATHNTYQGLLTDGARTAASALYNLPDMVDRIGGGDAFMAGLLYQLLRGSAIDEAVDFAAAAAALKHYVRGDANLSTLGEIDALRAGNTGGAVQR
jgi:2-dehydro-3-deoxygluconokinase